MSEFSFNLSIGLLLAFSLAAAIFFMVMLARWARRRSKGAVVAGALLSMFAPDPTLEKNIKLAEEAKQVQSEEDREGEGKDPETKTGLIREANINDVPAMKHLRLQVRENVLSDPGRITTAMIADAISASGRGWIFEEDAHILGFSIALRKDPSIWALFVHPDHERRGIGHALHEVAVNWLWSQGVDRIWLNTDPETRAERFYRKHGWQEAVKHDNGEIRFELDRHIKP